MVLRRYMFAYPIRLFLAILVLTATTVAVVACGGEPAPTAVSPTVAPSATPIPIATQIPTATATLMPTATPMPTNTPMPTPTSTLTPFEELKTEAIQLSYDDLFRNNEQHIGKKVWLTAKIIQVIEIDSDEFQLRAKITENEGFWNDTVFLQYSGPRLLEDDIIEFVGSVYGLITYESVSGQEITIPAITFISAASRRLEAEASIASGTRENPIPVGNVAVFPDWKVSVVSFDPNATKTIIAENRLNDSPDHGHVYIMVRVQGTYTGNRMGEMSSDLKFYVVGDANLLYDDPRAVIPYPLSDQPGALAGGTVEGNIKFVVPFSEVNSLVLVVSDGSLRYADTVVYFSLE